jgi:ribonucleotide monophosphatase NagD (HAD superfamily)
MGLEIKYLPKREEKMAKYKLEERLYIVGKDKDRKVMSEADLKSIKDARVEIILLGGPGSEIPMEQAQELGLVAASKAAKPK